MVSLLRPKGRFAIKRIAIVGAGPSGLAAAKYLLAEKCFLKIDIYEQQSEVGGVWNYTPITGEKVSIPSTTPHVPPDPPIWPGQSKAPLFSNPMYERLNTNIPKTLMRFSDLEFPVDSLLFPTRQDVQEYLLKYSQDIRHLISFSTQVDDIKLLSDEGRDIWEVTTKSTITGDTRKSSYDAIVSANGHYSIPFIPSVPGIEEFNNKFPNIITHSKIYRSPESFTGRKVIVVGNGPSGFDIGTQIEGVCQSPLLNSVTTPIPGIKNGKEEVPHIAEYLPSERGIRFEDGRIEKDIDAIVYCTGYLYGYHFLETIQPPPVTTGRRVLGAYKHVFDIHHPTLAFTALMQKVIPFPVSESQGAVIAKIWSNKLELPSTEEMERWELKRIEEAGQGKAFHVLGYPQDAEYINGFYKWAKSAGEELGKDPPYWGDRELYTRQIYTELKEKFVEMGGKARTMEELGFEFKPEESWKRR